MLSNFFIERPIFSWVISLLIIGAGILASLGLPVQQYPEIAPPEVTISATYPGASAETLENTVTQVIEQNLTGIDNLRYFTSSSSSSGFAQITLTFDTGTDPDIAQVQTQNKLALALPMLPSQAQELGIPVTKSSGTFLMVVAFYSKSGDMNQNDISDFVASKIIEPVSRVEGVGNVRAFGPQHAMRVWLDPNKMYNYNLTTLEVIDAIRNQNSQLATGQIGGAPSIKGQMINATITSQELLNTPEEFQKIILRTLPDGSMVTLSDIARVEIGSEDYNSIRRFNQKNAAGFGVSLASGANALETIQAVKARIEDFKQSFPEDLEVSYPVDVAPFITSSIMEVIITLGIAVMLVLIVMYVFLQSFSTTFIPGIAIPVVLLGTLASLYAFGFSINILTMFALVLSIGMLVDDTIVVTEDIKRSLEEDGDISSKEAAKKSMQRLTGALVGTTAVLWAVFAPMIFFGGSTGVIYKQFSITVISSMTISLFVALTFSPSLAGSILQQKNKEQKGFFKWFNNFYDKLSHRYSQGVDWVLNHIIISLIIFLILVGLTLFFFFRIPVSFLPAEDQGRLITIIQGPPNSTFERTDETLRQVENFYSKSAKDVIDSFFAVAGFSFSGQGQNTAIAFIRLKDFDARKGENVGVESLAMKANKEFSQISNAQVFSIVPPPISELGNASGFELQLVDTQGIGHKALVMAKNEFLKLANQSKFLTNVRMNALEDNPQFEFKIDDNKAQALGVETTVMNNTLSAAWGGMYVNDYVEEGRVKRVFIQADAPFRMKPEDLARWYVRNNDNQMVSFGDIGKGRWDYGSPLLLRYNGQSSYEIQGEASPGISTGQAMEEIQKIVKKLPKGVGLEWTGLSYEERQAGSQVYLLYTVSLIAIFLCLAALYESWSIPLSIILILPLGILGATFATWIFGQTNDVYFKVGFLLTMGLAAKNAILIVEFARQAKKEGKKTKEAVIEACKQRFRPVIMTSVTFILGVLPLAIASGPGSGAQNSIGIGLVGGITSTTLFIIFFSPLFFLLLERTKEEKGEKNA